MTDKNWMLNPTAIAQARSCIAIIKNELGIKLRLSHPQFLQLIFEYIDLTDSEELAEAYNVLASYADSKLPTVKLGSRKATVTSIAAKSQPVEINSQMSVAVDRTEMVEHRGKLYPKFSENGEFKGLYRGQARYG